MAVTINVLNAGNMTIGSGNASEPLSEYFTYAGRTITNIVRDNNEDLVTLPDVIVENYATSIGEYGIYDYIKTNITSMTFSEVTSIGEYGFASVDVGIVHFPKLTNLANHCFGYGSPVFSTLYLNSMTTQQVQDNAGNWGLLPVYQHLEIICSNGTVIFDPQ